MENQDELFTDVSKAELLSLVRGILNLSFEQPVNFNPIPEIKGSKTRAILDLPMGIFVTLKIGGTLRGCIGQFTSSKPLGTILPQVTRDAAFRDPRFNPLTFNELQDVCLSLSLLSPDKPVPSWQEIKLGQHGIILEAQGRRSVFLPEVPIEQGWDLETTLTALARKAGLGPQAWQQPDAEFRVFASVYISEEHGAQS